MRAALLVESPQQTTSNCTANHEPILASLMTLASIAMETLSPVQVVHSSRQRFAHGQMSAHNRRHALQLPMRGG
jgi:hypothetical protein